MHKGAGKLHQNSSPPASEEHQQAPCVKKNKNTVV